MHTDDGKCGAKTRSGEPCRGLAMENGRCRLHGGKSPVRIGPYSRSLPARLAERAEIAWHDADLISQRRNLAVYEALIEEACGTLESDPSHQCWTDAREAFKDLQAAIQAGDAGRLKECMRELSEAFDSAHKRERNEIRLRSLMLESARVGEAELKRLDRLAQFVTAQQAAALQAGIISILQRHLSAVHPELVRRIATDIEHLGRSHNAH